MRQVLKKKPCSFNLIKTKEQKYFLYISKVSQLAYHPQQYIYKVYLNISNSYKILPLSNNCCYI